MIAIDLLLSRARQVAGRAATGRLPVMYSLRALVEADRLVSYAADLLEIWRRAAHDVDKILRGAKPADLPIEQPTKYGVMIWA